MKLPLNQSMILTRNQRKGGIILPFFITLLVIISGQLISIPFVILGIGQNSPMIDELISLFANIFPIILIMLLVL